MDIALTAATLATTQVPGYTVKAVTSVDNRGLTLPVEPDTGKTTESGQPIGNNVTCNLEIRQAMAYAIDRQQVAAAALNGFGSPCYSENDGMPWNNPEVALETDAECAQETPADGGWADTDGVTASWKVTARGAEFTCLYGAGDSVRQAVAMATAEQLRSIGIQMHVEGTSWDDISKRMFSNAVLMGWGAANPYESYWPVSQQTLRLRTTTTTSRGLCFLSDRRLSGGRHGGPGTRRDGLSKLEAGSNGTAPPAPPRKDSAPGSGSSMCSMCTMSATAWTSAPSSSIPTALPCPCSKISGTGLGTALIHKVIDPFPWGIANSPNVRGTCKMFLPGGHIGPPLRQMGSLGRNCSTHFVILVPCI
ncbi:MAG: ABC transporter substrate-binding protein [Oscillospiraceae bacterium]